MKKHILALGAMICATGMMQAYNYRIFNHTSAPVDTGLFLVLDQTHVRTVPAKGEAVFNFDGIKVGLCIDVNKTWVKPAGQAQRGTPILFLRRDLYDTYVNEARKNDGKVPYRIDQFERVKFPLECRNTDLDIIIDNEGNYRIISYQR